MPPRRGEPPEPLPGIIDAHAHVAWSREFDDDRDAVLERAWAAGLSRIVDVGVAGLHRVLDRTEDLRSCTVVVVVAGMDGALPSVIGGLIPQPIVAVPTSVGYGTGLGGIAALLAMLNSCAPGVTVVNIDNGFGAAYAASRINHAVAAAR